MESYLIEDITSLARPTLWKCKRHKILCNFKAYSVLIFCTYVLQYGCHLSVRWHLHHIAQFPFILCGRAFKISSLSTSVSSPMLLSVITMPQIPRCCSLFNWKFTLFEQHLPISPIPWQPPIFCFYEFGFFRFRV